MFSLFRITLCLLIFAWADEAVDTKILRLPECNKFDAKFSVMFRNKRMTGGLLLARLQSMTFEDCVVRCIRFKRCSTINHNENKTLCELNAKEVGDNRTVLEHNTGWVHAETPKNQNKVCNGFDITLL